MKRLWGQTIQRRQRPQQSGPVAPSHQPALGGRTAESEVGGGASSQPPSEPLKERKVETRFGLGCHPIHSIRHAIKEARLFDWFDDTEVDAEFLKFRRA
jgi:hypothetical protein